ncbi:MAG: hypothetical protein K8L91_24590 [Anaerolineae bacterium]|nr:hypothetical protein [Anaerolineae bacterium]
MGKHVFYHWYLFHSDMLDMLWTLLPIVALLVGVITPENIMVKIVLMFLVGAIIFWDMILGAGASSDGILRMHHRGSTRYEGHIYYLADFEMPDWWGGWHRDSARVLYQCDSLGLICSSEFSITDDDRKEILDRIQ